MRHHLPAENPQRFQLRRIQFARHAIDHAQRTQRIALRGKQRRAGVKADVRIAGDIRMIHETFIQCGVRDNEQARVENRMRTKGDVARCLGARDTDLGLVELHFFANHRDERDGRIANMRRQRGEIIESLIRQCIKHIVRPKRLQSVCFVGWSKRRFHAKFRADVCQSGRERPPEPLS